MFFFIVGNSLFACLTVWSQSDDSNEFSIRLWMNDLGITNPSFTTDTISASPGNLTEISSPHPSIQTEGRKAVDAMPSLEMVRSKRRANSKVLVIFHHRATLAAEHRDSSAIPFKKAPRAPLWRSRRKRWKIIQVKWFSLMWLWQNLVLSLKRWVWSSTWTERAVLRLES